MRPQNAVIHSTTVELLQTIVARGETELVVVESIEAIVVGKLYYCIHTNRLDLQNKLLHLLHSVISASTADDLVRPFAGKHRQGERPPDILTTFDSTQEAQPRAYAVNPLLIQTLMDGISVPANRPVLQHWLDFVLMAVPQFQPALHAVVAPLNECICRQLQTSLDHVLKASSHDDTFSDDMNSTITDAEFIMLLNGLERLVLLSLAYTSELLSPEEDQSGVEKSAESGGLLGYVSTVFSSENTPQNVDEQLTVRFHGIFLALADNLCRFDRRDIAPYEMRCRFCIRYGVYYVGQILRRVPQKTNRHLSSTIVCAFAVAECLNICSECSLLRFLKLL